MCETKNFKKPLSVANLTSQKVGAVSNSDWWVSARHVLYQYLM